MTLSPLVVPSYFIVRIVIDPCCFGLSVSHLPTLPMTSFQSAVILSLRFKKQEPRVYVLSALSS